MRWVLPLLGLAACDHEEPLSKVDHGQIHVVRGQLDGEPDTWQVELDLWGDDDKCLGLSKSASASIDGDPLELVWRGGWGYNLIDLQGGCSGSRFWLDDLELDPQQEVSTVVIEDHGARVEFEVSHLAVPHEVGLPSPLPPASEVQLEVLPAHPRVQLDPESSLLLATPGGYQQWDIPLESASSFVTPDFCVGGTWDLYPPSLIAEVDAPAGFQVLATLGVEPMAVQTQTRPTPPACPLDLLYTELAEVPPGTALDVGEVFVVSPRGPGGFFVAEGVWIEDPQGLYLAPGEGVEIVGVYSPERDEQGAVHDRLTITEARPTGTFDEFAEAVTVVLPRQLDPSFEGLLVQLPHVTVEEVGDEGFVADGVPVGDWWLEPGGVEVGDEIDYLAGIWHWDSERGWMLLPRGQGDVR
jgi:hypothetical protein